MGKLLARGSGARCQKGSTADRRQSKESRGLKPVSAASVNVRAEARTYLRNKGNGKGKDESEIRRF